jgi:histone deacetylase complex regulatory component SIN3
MSSVLYQSLNNNGSNMIRSELNSLRNQLSESKKEMSFLVKALEEKAPEVLEEYKKLKAQDAQNVAQAQVQASLNRAASAPSVGPLRR